MTSLALQITAIIIRSWFGFSFAIHSENRNVSQEMSGGLFLVSPSQICVDEGNGTDCKSPERLTANDNKTFEATNQLLTQSVLIPRILVLVGLAASTCGWLLLYCYLCLSKRSNKQRCVGVTSAIFWIFAALPEFTAVGIQIFVNLNMTNTVNFIAVTVKELGIHVFADFITPWAVFALGAGASLNVIIGIIVALPTCEKDVSKTVILYSKLSKGQKDRFRILDHDDEYDSDL